jgi:catechol 2,3-dioxygenase-like lactoylglutathione lyase family enzyme
MSRMHLHVAVADIDQNTRFYTALFGAEPTVVKPDYVKWELTDPAVNFAISNRGRAPGLDHVGIQAASTEELETLRARLEAANIQGAAQEATACCYARSDKYWVQDPQGLAWETFHTLGSVPTFNEGEGETAATGACCVPAIPVLSIQVPLTKLTKRCA